MRTAIIDNEFEMNSWWDLIVLTLQRAHLPLTPRGNFRSTIFPATFSFRHFFMIRIRKERPPLSENLKKLSGETFLADFSDPSHLSRWKREWEEQALSYKCDKQKKESRWKLFTREEERKFYVQKEYAHKSLVPDCRLINWINFIVKLDSHISSWSIYMYIIALGEKVFLNNSKP